MRRQPALHAARMLLRRINVVAIALCVSALPAAAFNSGSPTTSLPTAIEHSATLLKEIDGVVSWKALAQVESVNRDGKIVPEFSREILGLDKQVVRVQGFMLPLEMSDQQKHFLISAVPPSCPFCMPAGPEAIVEVICTKPIKYGIEPMVVAGKLTVLKDDQNGLLYRMVDAELVPAPQK